MRLTATFPKPPALGEGLAEFRWSDGTVATLERSARKHRGAMLPGGAPMFVHDLAAEEENLASQWSVVRRRLPRAWARRCGVFAAARSPRSACWLLSMAILDG